MTTQFARIRDVEIAFELSGPSNAPVVLLSHCFSADHRFWDAHLRSCEAFRVLRYDTRGHGASGRPRGPYTLDLLADEIPNASLHWLSPARHLATLEHVDAFNAMLRAHLEKVLARP